MADEYPVKPADRSRWIVDRRVGGRAGHEDEERVQAAFLEWEPAEGGGRALVSTLFLTNRECPWRCAMCDLWRHTLDHSVSVGAIPRQIDQALKALDGAGEALPGAAEGEGQDRGGRVRQLKLYNSGSFFDVGAIPEEDYEAIARRCVGYERIIVECHPRLVNERIPEFLGHLVNASEGGAVPRLEVALGWETVHPEVLERLNKRVTLSQLREATRRLRSWGVAVRAFLLAGLPWIPVKDWERWASQSIDAVLEEGVGVVSWIPLRLGNGALDVLAGSGLASEPALDVLEAHQDMGLGKACGRARVFADTWDLERFSRCERCFAGRLRRIRTLNQRQSWEPRVPCENCGSGRGLS